MNKNVLVILSLICIIVLGAFLRLINLENIPNGLYVDEASTVYNAWSIQATGKDEYGKSFPLMMRFLGSYSPPLYTYLTSLTISFMGLSIFTARLVSAISGIFAILTVYILLKKINNFKSFLTPLFGALFLAISPWSIFYSRIGYEIHLSFTVYIIGVLFLWSSLKSPKWLILAFGLISLSTNIYHAQRLLALLTILIFLVIFRKDLIKKDNQKILILSFIVYLLILIPQILLFFTPANTSRGFGLFYADAIINQANKYMLPMILSYPIAFFREFFSQYFSYLSPRNLFFQPDSDLQRSLSNLSTFYPWMVVLFAIGVIKIIKLHKEKIGKFILMLFLLSPIPAALAGDPFSTQRSLALLLPIIVVMAFGVDKIISKKNKTVSIFIILVINSLFLLYQSYGVLLPNERARVWGYGFGQLAQEIKKRPNEKFLIDSSRIKPAYIELAFYLKFPPDEFQKSVDQTIKDNYYQNTNWDSFYKFGNIETREIVWIEDVYKEQIIVGDELAISEGQAKEHFLTQVFEIIGPDHMVIFRGFKTNPDEKCHKSYIKEICPK